MSPHLLPLHPCIGFLVLCVDLKKKKKARNTVLRSLYMQRISLEGAQENEDKQCCARGKDGWEIDFSLRSFAFF